MVAIWFGKRGSGKTTSIRGQLEKCRPPVVVVDILGNFQNNDENDYFQARDLSDAIEFIGNYVEDQNNNRLDENTHRICVVKAPDPDETIEYVSAALWQAGQGTLVIDEADEFDPRRNPVFDNLIRYGRNRNIDILAGCRRPAEMDRNMSAAANKLFLFQTHEPRDIEYFEKTILGKRARQLMTLPDYHGVFVNYNNKTLGIFRIDEKGNVFILKDEKL